MFTIQWSLETEVPWENQSVWLIEHMHDLILQADGRYQTQVSVWERQVLLLL